MSYLLTRKLADQGFPLDKVDAVVLELENDLISCSGLLDAEFSLGHLYFK